MGTRRVILIVFNLLFAGSAAAQSTAANPGDQVGEPLPPGALARLGIDFFRHEGNIRALAFTSDGKTLAGYTVSSGIIIWNAKTGQVRRTVPVNLSTDSFALVLSPDGALVAALEGPPWGKQYKMSLWEVSTGEPMGTLPLSDEEGAGAPDGPPSFSPDGKSLAVSAGGSVLVFDVHAGLLRHTLGQKGLHSCHCAFSPDSKTLASAVYPVATDVGELRPSLQLWDIGAAKLIHTIGTLPPVDAKRRSGPMTFAPDGKSLAYASADRILLLDTATGNRLGELAPDAGRITDLDFTADGSRLVSNSATGAILVWNTNTRALVRIIDKGSPAADRRMALAAGRQTLAVSTPPLAGKSTQTVRLWDLATGEEGASRAQGHEFAVNFLAWPADGKTLVSGADDKVLFWNKDYTRRSDILPGHLRPLALARAGKLAVVERVRSAMGVGATGTALHIVDAASAKTATTLNLPGNPIMEAARFSPDGRKLFALESNIRIDNNAVPPFGFELALRHWNVATAKQERLWAIPFSARVQAIASVDGKAVITNKGQQFTVHDADSGRSRVLVDLAKQNVHSLWPSPDGRLVAVTLFEGNSGPGIRSPDVLLVEVLTGKPTMLLKGDRASVSVVAWSADSRTIAVGDIRPTYSEPDNVHIHLWDTLTGVKMSRIGDLNADVTALGFAPGGVALATGQRDGSIFVFSSPGPKPGGSVPALSKDKAEECWKKLLGDEAATAHQAVGALIASPDVAVPFLARRVKPARAQDKEKIRQLIANLDSETFAVRQSATKELHGFGDQAAAQIRSALKENVSLEAHRRLQQIFNALADIPSPETVRSLRGIMALERIASKEAVAVLRMLANGEPEARETEDARAALERVAWSVPEVGK